MDDVAPPDETTRKSALTAGFTLIELSVVLVIIGLIVGGVLVGQSLIHAAALRAIITEKDRFSAAIYTFLGKYDYLPGDFPNTSNMLGTPMNGNGWYAEGNGNGIIDDEETVGGDGHYDGEVAFFWSQLSFSGMVAGSWPSGYYRAIPGTNVPASAYGSGAGWTIANSTNVATFFNPTETYFLTYYHIFVFGAAIPAGGFDGPNLSPVLTPADSYNIDKKLDDGLPASGNVIAMGWAGSYSGMTWNCTTTDVASTAAYNQAVATPTCLIYFANMW